MSAQEEFIEALRKLAQAFARVGDAPYAAKLLEAAIQKEARDGMDKVEDYANGGDA